MPTDTTAQLARYGYERLDFTERVVHYYKQLPDTLHNLRCILDNPHHQRAQFHDSYSALMRLPTELVHRIIHDLDPRSVSDLCLVNTVMLRSVLSFYVVQELLHFAAPTLKALSMTRLLDAYSMRQLHHELRNDRCAYCHKRYGGFLFLLEGRRCCHFCQQTTRLKPIPLNTAKEIFKAQKAEPRRLKVLHTVPGAIDRRGTVWKHSMQVVSFWEACTATEDGPCGDLVPSSLAEMRPINNLLQTFEFFADIACAHMPSVFDPTNNLGAEYGTWCRGCDHMLYEHHRDADRMPREFPTGGPAYDALVAYSARDFAEHFKVCPGIKAMMVPPRVIAHSRSQPSVNN